jgi:hypothetical protein
VTGGPLLVTLVITPFVILIGGTALLAKHRATVRPAVGDTA